MVLHFFIQGEVDGNDFLERIITSNAKLDPILQSRKKIREHGSEKNRKCLRKFENEWSTGQVMLNSFWDYCGLVYAEFGPDVHTEK